MKRHLTLKEASLIKLRIVSVRSNKDKKRDESDDNNKDNDNDDNNKDNDNDNSLIGKMYDILNDNLNEINIGRSRRSNHIVIKDLSISTNHAKIEFRKGRLYLKDLQSKHGTYVNNKKLLIEEYIINIGTEIRFGRINCELVNLEPILITKEVEHISIKNMNYHENLLRIEELYQNYNQKKRNLVSNVIDNNFNNNNNNNNNNSNIFNNNHKNEDNNNNNTNKRYKFIKNTNMVAPILNNNNIDDNEKVYGIGAVILKHLGHDPKKKLGKNNNDNDANKPLQVKIRRKNLGLGAH